MGIVTRNDGTERALWGAVGTSRPKGSEMKLWLTCGAKNRRGLPCQVKELYENGRCKFHGGLSTGPKTPEGNEWLRPDLRRIVRAAHCAKHQPLGCWRETVCVPERSSASAEKSVAA